MSGELQEGGALATDTGEYRNPALETLPWGEVERSLLRYSQYQRSLVDDRAFQRHWMQPVAIAKGKSKLVVEADEGVHPYTAEGLAALKPVMQGGVTTYGSQTRPGKRGCQLRSGEAGNHAQLVCRQRPVVRAADRLLARTHEPVWLQPDLRPPAGTDRAALDRRAGARIARSRWWHLNRLRCRRHRSSGGSVRRVTQLLIAAKPEHQWSSQRLRRARFGGQHCGLRSTRGRPWES